MVQHVLHQEHRTAHKKPYDVIAGDVFFLFAGRVHAIGAGCFIAEIQQTSERARRYDEALCAGTGDGGAALRAQLGLIARPAGASAAPEDR